MSDELSLQGSLEEASVVDLVRGIVRGKESATMTLAGEGARATIHFLDGRLVAAGTDDPDGGLAESLFRAGQIDLEALTRVKERGGDAGRALCELQIIRPEDLMRGLELQARQVIRDLFLWQRGSYDVQFHQKLPAGTLPLQLPSDRLLLDAVARIERWSQIARGLHGFDTVVRRTPDQDRRLYDFDLNEAENAVMTLCESPFAIRELCRMTYLPQFETCRSVLGLLCVDLLEDIRPSEPGAAPESPIQAVVENFNRAYTAMYRIVYQRIGEEIQDFVLRLVDGLPHEHARAFRGIDLSEGGRVDAARLEANLQTERSADPSGAAHELLNELLYQWVLVIKQEFGADVERDVAQALNTMKPE